MDIKISLEATGSERFDKDALGMLMRDMNADLNEEFESKFEEQAGSAGGKGLMEFAPIILSLVGTGGVVVSLINVFNTYLSKSPTLELEMQKKNGNKIKIKAVDLEPERLRQTINVLDEYLKE